MWRKIRKNIKICLKFISFEFLFFFYQFIYLASVSSSCTLKLLRLCPHFWSNSPKTWRRPWQYKRSTAKNRDYFINVNCFVNVVNLSFISRPRARVFQCFLGWLNFSLRHHHINISSVIVFDLYFLHQHLLFPSCSDVDNANSSFVLMKTAFGEDFTVYITYFDL